MGTPFNANLLIPESSNQTNHNLPPDFVHAVFAGCSIHFDPDTHLPISSHEILFLTPHRHKNPLMFIELPQNLWNSPALDEATGNLEHLPWQTCHNLDDLTVLDFQSFPTTAPIFLPRSFIISGHLISATPSEIPTFRLTASSTIPATHLLAKVLWQLPGIAPNASEYEIRVAIANHDKLAEHYVSQVRTLFPATHYWHAMNLNSPCGVDYWILPLKTAP